MNILNESEIFAAKDIANIEKTKNATYVCETCLKGPNGWNNQAVAIFWNNDPANVPAGGSRWFGLFFSHGGPPDFEPGPLMITNAISATEVKISAIMADNGDIIYSRFRHDYRTSPDGSVFIDGGRDYTKKPLAPHKWVFLKIIEDKLVVVDKDMFDPPGPMKYAKETK